MDNCNKYLKVMYDPIIVYTVIITYENGKVDCFNFTDENINHSVNTKTLINTIRSSDTYPATHFSQKFMGKTRDDFTFSITFYTNFKTEDSYCNNRSLMNNEYSYLIEDNEVPEKKRKMNNYDTSSSVQFDFSENVKSYEKNATFLYSFINPCARLVGTSYIIIDRKFESYGCFVDFLHKNSIKWVYR